MLGCYTYKNSAGDGRKGNAIEYFVITIALLLGAEVHGNTTDSGPIDMMITLPPSPRLKKEVRQTPPCLLAA